MTADITRARNAGQTTPVYAPVYGAPLSAEYSDVSKCQITNLIEGTAKGSSILSMVESGPKMMDIQGRTVGMITKVGEDVFRDVVEVVGETKASYIVRIGGTDYAVRKAIVRFVTGVE